jgi:hypothetical protein
MLMPAGSPDQGRALGVVAFNCPTYPHLARLANVQGDVHLQAEVSRDGRVQAVRVLSGAPALAGYSRENLLTWAFTPGVEGTQLEIVFSFRLRPPREYYDPPPTVVLQSPTHVTVTSSIPLPSGGPETLKRRR